MTIKRSKHAPTCVLHNCTCIHQELQHNGQEYAAPRALCEEGEAGHTRPGNQQGQQRSWQHNVRQGCMTSEKLDGWILASYTLNPVYWRGQQRSWQHYARQGCMTSERLHG